MRRSDFFDQFGGRPLTSGEHKMIFALISQMYRLHDEYCAMYGEYFFVDSKIEATFTAAQLQIRLLMMEVLEADPFVVTALWKIPDMSLCHPRHVDHRLFIKQIIFAVMDYGMCRSAWNWNRLARCIGWCEDYDMIADTVMTSSSLKAFAMMAR